MSATTKLVDIEHKQQKFDNYKQISNMENSYDDIINMPHHVSKNHPQMSLESRAAQFAPFAALSGFEEAIEYSAKNFQKENTKNAYIKNDQLK